MEYQPIPRGKQQLGGALIASLGIGGTVWIWHKALTEGYFYSKASMLMPAAAVLGLAMVLIPGYKEERFARGEDFSHLSGLALLTPRWWAILIIALVAGIGNFLLLQFG
jgi:hypothetical protein